MKCDKRTMLLYAVTNRSWTGEMNLFEQVEEVLKNGATCIQFREKDLDEDVFLSDAIKLAKLCKQYNIPFIINDKVDIAIKCKADGIHVGQEDMIVSNVRKRVGDDMIIGVSVHTVEEAVKAVKNGADYLGLGSVFPTSTKLDVGQMTYKMLKDICNAVDVPTVAIGGITKENIMQLSGCGIDGVAVVSAIFAAKDPGAATSELLTLAEKTVKKEQRI